MLLGLLGVLYPSAADKSLVVFRFALHRSYDEVGTRNACLLELSASAFQFLDAPAIAAVVMRHHHIVICRSVRKCIVLDGLKIVLNESFGHFTFHLHKQFVKLTIQEGDSLKVHVEILK